MTPSMDSVMITAFWFGIISACSLPLGALTTLVWRPADRAIAFLMAFGGGALLAALAIDLVAGTVAMGHFYPLAAGCICGGLLFIGLNEILNDFGGFLRKTSTRIYHLRKLEYRKFKQILSVLQRVDVFTELPDKEFKVLAVSINALEIKKGALLFSHGDPCEYLYIIASGKVNLIDPLEKKATLHLQVNDDVGWLAFITGTPYRFTARATENTSLWVLPHNAFVSLLPNSPILQQAVHRWLRSSKVATYLHQYHGLTNLAVQTWSDKAVHQLLHRGVYDTAIKINHNSASFQALANHIRRFDLFNYLSRDELDAIAVRLIYRKLSVGETFFHIGEEAERMFIIEHGEASLLSSIIHSERAILRKAEDTLGSMAFLTGSRHTMSAMVVKEASVWILRRKDFKELITKLPELAEQYVVFLQQDEVTRYLQERQKMSHDSVILWKNKAIKNILGGKALVPVTAINFDIKEHHGAPLGIWLGLTLDSIPESLVIGSSLTQTGLGFSLLAGLFFSNYPEALSSSVGMRQQGMKFKIILLMWTVLMLSTGILSALGSIYFAGVSHSTFAFTEGVAAGAMLTMIAQTMLPEAYLKGGEIVGFSTLLGFLCAIFFKTLE